MRIAKHLYAVFFLALALALGQYAGLLHGLGHATEQLSHKPGTPAKVACDQCFACSQLSGGGAQHVPAVHPACDAHDAHPLFVHAALELVTSVVFHSRAPPVLA
jgi:hypothetical protein